MDKNSHIVHDETESPPLRQAGKVWHGRGSPARGTTLNPGGPSAPARLSLWPILPDARTGMPDGPPTRPLPPGSSRSLLSRASVLPFHTRPSSSETNDALFTMPRFFYQACALLSGLQCWIRENPKACSVAPLPLTLTPFFNYFYSLNLQRNPC